MLNELNSLKYTKDHEWLKINGDIGYIGITDFAQNKLGDIIFIEVNTILQTLQQGEIFGTIETVKSVSDLFMPISGKILSFNKELENSPEIINKSPYDIGWIIEVKILEINEYKNLMSFEEYKKYIV